MPGPRDLGQYLQAMMELDCPVPETSGGLLVDCGPHRPKNLEGAPSMSTADSGPAGASGSCLIVVPQTQKSGVVLFFTVSLGTKYQMPSLHVQEIPVSLNV